ncbi:MAG: extracellular solute-binding protein [Alphaproteobacteria bacterium]|nr:extracellular solute-binding protein [Alphaproteobacteria bacterium]
MRILTGCLIALLLISSGAARADESGTSHGWSLFGDLKYPPDFKRFDYVNPEAPRGGTLRLSAVGGFDSLNPFILKGDAATGSSMIYDRLLTGSYDEAGAEYGLLAKSVEAAEDFSWVEFTLRPEARWHDGKPVTPEDVVFSFNILREKGAPVYRFYYANVKSVTKAGAHGVRFEFDTAGNRELPLIMGQLPILPAHYWKGRDFEATTLEPPLGSGPYRIGKVDANRSITLERVKDYWGKDLAVNVGAHNFDQIVFEYYRDDTVALEAFKANNFDMRNETSAKNWATAYDFPAAKQGKVTLAELETRNAEPMQGFLFNIRKSKFSDPRVRLAFNYAFDFEWANKNLFYGQYARSSSYFQNSELAASALPDAAELALLEPFRAQLPPEVFTSIYKPPSTDGSGNNRDNLREAQRLLAEAGWQVKNGGLTNTTSGEKMQVEFLLDQPNFERIVSPYVRSLERLGIKASIRMVDTAQYQNRTDAYDFDIVIGGIANSLSPGNEQREYWSSAAADRPGSRNLAGVNSPVVDALIDKIIFAEDRAALIAASRALDRVLLWGHYLVPQWHSPVSRIAYWNVIDYPRPTPDYNIGFPDLWWYKGATAP